MGKGSKAQTIGYKYYLGMHLGLCHGPIDAITRLQVDGRDAWTGYNSGGTINVSAEELFGGKKREGGVSGAIDVAMGGPTQGKNSYLVGKLGSLIPAYRGIVGLIFRQCYLGNNPYLKLWSARGQRVFTRQDGVPQWNMPRAAIPSFNNPSTSPLPLELTWWQSSYHSGGGDNAGMGVKFYNAAGVEIGSAFSTIISTPRFAWTQRTLNATQPAGTAYLAVYMQMQRVQGSNNDGYIDDIQLNVGGGPVSIFNPGGEEGDAGWTVETGGFRSVTGGVGDYPPPHSGSRYFDGGTSGFSSIYQQVGVGQLDLNPAHIIRECLTDPEWGMGYTDDDIDEPSFLEAADIFFAEKLGMSLLWDRQVPLEDFVQNVLRHVDAALYVSRTTGKYVLKAIRGDYDVEDLITLDESNISSVDDPVRVSFGELTNSVTVKFWDATTGKDGSVTVTDTALVQQQGVVINAPVQYPGFSNARNATVAAQRDLKVLSSPLLSCTITADSDAKELNIGVVFKFSWAKWGLSNVVMRVTGISYGTGRNRKVKINCTEDVFETNTVSVITQGGNAWEDPNQPPSAVVEQLATEAPYYELVQALGQADVDNKLLTHPEIGYVIAAAARPTAAINASLLTDDGSGFEDVGTFDFCPKGVLASALLETTTEFTLEDFSDLEEVVLGSHVQIGQELMRVDAVNASTGEIVVGRGVLDTVPQLHVPGEVALFWDLSAGFDPTEYVSGEEIDVKVLPISGAGVLAESEASAITVELDQRAARPYAPGDLRLNGQSYEANAFYEGEVTISWAHRNRLEQTGGSLDDYTTGNIGPEAGTLYRVQGYIDDVLVHTEDDIDGNSTVWTPLDISSNIRVEVHSKRDGLYSWQAPSHRFSNDAGGERFSEEGDERLTEDGDSRIL